MKLFKNRNYILQLNCSKFIPGSAAINHHVVFFHHRHRHRLFGLFSPRRIFCILPRLSSLHGLCQTLNRTPSVLTVVEQQCIN